MSDLDTGTLLLLLLYLGHGLRNGHGASLGLLIYVTLYQTLYGNGLGHDGEYLDLGSVATLLHVAVAAALAAARPSHHHDLGCAVVAAYALAAVVGGLHEALAYADGGAGKLHVVAGTALLIGARLEHEQHDDAHNSHLHDVLLVAGYLGLNGGAAAASLVAGATSYLLGHLAKLNDGTTNLLVGLVAVGSSAASLEATYEPALAALLGLLAHYLASHHLAGLLGDHSATHLHLGVGLYSLLHHIVHAAYSGGDIATVATHQLAGAAALILSAAVTTALVSVVLDTLGVEKLLNGGGDEEPAAEEEAAGEA